MAASRRDCVTRRGGHCVTNTGSGFSCIISTITNREYAGDQWSPVFYCFVGNHRSGCRNNRTGRRVSSSPKRSPCRLSPGAPAARRCKPSSRSLHTPSMVVPPGEHTAFMSAIGCSELFIASAPLPITVAVAISSARRSVLQIPRGHPPPPERQCTSKQTRPMPRRELRMPETGLHLYGTPCRPTRISRRRFLYVRSLPPCRRISPLRRL